jgi:hypothetical protein
MYLHRENAVYSGNSIKLEAVEYIFADRDCNISGKGKTESGNGFTATIHDLNLNLKQGWNSLCLKLTANETSFTISITLRDPSSAKWILENDEYGYSYMKTPGISGNRLRLFQNFSF